MKFHNHPVEWAGATSKSAGANADSDWIDCARLDGFSALVVITASGGCTGTLQLQASNDDPGTGDTKVLQASVTNIINLPNTSTSVSLTGSNAGTFGWDQGLFHYRWVRIDWVNSTGSGTITGRWHKKAVND